MYRSYSLYIKVFPDSEPEFLMDGRIKCKSYTDYERQLARIWEVLNKNSLYKYIVVSCYEYNPKNDPELPF